MLRAALMSCAIVIAAGCTGSHQANDAAPPVDTGPPVLGRCTSAPCSWSDECPPEPTDGVVGSPCTTRGAYCAYCLGSASFDSVTLVCLDGAWQPGVCGCPCP